METTSIVREGNEQDAENYIRARHEESLVGESIQGWPPNEFQEIVLPNGTDVYASIAPDNFWSAPGTSEESSWTSSIAYVKNGYVITMYLGDRADLYITELDLITKTTLVETSD